MKNVQRGTILLLMALTVVFTACQEEEISNLGKTNRPPQGDADDFANQPSGVPYPEIIEQYYLANLTHYQGCRAWSIEWPEYANDVDPDMVPTFFATSTGHLNSLNYLLNASSFKRNKATFSLYADQKIEAATEVSDLWDWTGIGAEAVYFRKINKTADQIQKWVTTRPSNFENYWNDAGNIETTIEYQVGDFFIFQLPGQSPIRYGGIRVLSSSPRIIEAYLAIPN